MKTTGLTLAEAVKSGRPFKRAHRHCDCADEGDGEMSIELDKPDIRTPLLAKIELQDKRIAELEKELKGTYDRARGAADSNLDLENMEKRYPIASELRKGSKQ